MTSSRPGLRPIAALLVVGALLVSAAVAACGDGDVGAPPPDTTPRLCEPGVPVLPCDAGAPGAPNTCVGDPRATNNVRLLPTDRSFPVGCRGYFPARDCSALDNCYCRSEDEDAGTARWICEQ